MTCRFFLKEKYQLNFGKYRGNAGNSLGGSDHPEVQWWASHQGMKFSTFDNDNDRYDRNCAKEDKCGWWFNRYTTLTLTLLGLLHCHFQFTDMKEDIENGRFP